MVNSFEYPPTNGQYGLQQIVRRVGIYWVVLLAQEAIRLEAAFVDVLFNDLARISVAVVEDDVVQLAGREPVVPVRLVALNRLDD